MLDETPSGWQLCDFGEVAKIEWGDTSVTKKSYTEEGFTAYSAAGPDGFLPYFDFDCDAVVVSAIGANSGRVFWASGKWTAIKNTMVVLPLEGVLDIRFLYYKAQQQDFWHISGGAQPFIGLKNARKQNVLLPPLPEQERIAEILNSVDDSIRATEAVIAQAERVKRGLMEDLLTGGLGSEAIARGEVPEGWEVKQVGELADVKGGKRMPKGAPFSDVPTPYPYIRVSDFKNGTISKDDLKFVSPEHQRQIARYTIGKDDLYISIAGTLGIVGFVPEDLDGAQLTENAAKIVLKDATIISKEYLARVLQSEVGQAQIQVKKGVGGGVPKLALFRIAEINVPLPLLDEQQRIADVVGAVDAMLEENHRSVDQLQRLKRGLMDDLLTGRVRTV